MASYEEGGTFLWTTEPTAVPSAYYETFCHFTKLSEDWCTVYETKKTLYGTYKEFGVKNVELLRFGKKKIFFLECSYSYFCASNIIIFMLRSVVGRDLDPKPTDSDSKLNTNRV
jgi:hypothetical protein